MQFSMPRGVLRTTLKGWLYTDVVHPVDARQYQLTDDYIVPHLADIEDAVWSLRGAFDANIREELSRPHWKRAKRRKVTASPYVTFGLTYPIGYCREIRNAVLGGIFSHMGNPMHPGLRALRKFHNGGGVIKELSGIQHGKYFQNGIQVGAYWVDAANDTVDPERPSVEICPLAESGYEDITDFGLFAEVMGSYWNCAVFANKYFPYLAPLYPLMSIDGEGIIKIVGMSRGHIAMNALDGCGPAEDFILGGNGAMRSLPVEYCNLLGGMYVWHDEAFDYRTQQFRFESCHRFGAPEDALRSAFADHRQMLLNGHFPHVLHGAVDAVERFNGHELKLNNRSLRRLREEGVIPVW